MPWKEEAVASRHPPAPSDELPKVVFSGSLLEVASSLSTLDVSALSKMRVALPNRARSPVSFHGLALLRLIDAFHEKTRPGFANDV
jgi:hypothetical protein